MDNKIQNIENLLFVPLKQHITFNGQISIGVRCFSSAREFSLKGEKLLLLILNKALAFSMVIS